MKTVVEIAFVKADGAEDVVAILYGEKMLGGERVNSTEDAITLFEQVSEARGWEVTRNNITDVKNYKVK